VVVVEEEEEEEEEEVAVVVLALLMEPQVVLFEVGHSVEVVVGKVQGRDLELEYQ